ncbi:MAG: DUF1844 domain-containing protein [Myxococcota bacterium]|jgi:hypothetical protein
MTSQDETTDSKAKEETDESAARASEDLPKVDFSTFVLSLGTTALYQLGAMPDPASGESVEADPLVAQQTIDTLEMLRDKTLGNLDDSERQLIDSLLYELRMRFVESTR